MLESTGIKELAMQKILTPVAKPLFASLTSRLITRRSRRMRILMFRFYVGSHGGEDWHWSVAGCDRVKDGSSTFNISGANDVPEDPVS